MTNGRAGRITVQTLSLGVALAAVTACSVTSGAAGGAESSPTRSATAAPSTSTSSPTAPTSPTSAASDPPGTSQEPQDVTRATFTAQVVSVTDGDTVVAQRGAQRVTVRLLGVDTPEVYGGKECGGPEASAATKRLAEGRLATFVPDPTQAATDRYGRTLAYVEVHDPSEETRTDLSLALVTAGRASAYRLARGPAPERYPAYLAAQRTAQVAQIGQWRDCPAR